MAMQALAEGLIDVLQTLFGRFAGVRPSHAKGIFVKGKFTPSESAQDLCIAPHFQHQTNVIARLSLFTGIPDLASTDVKANPHGFAVRFLLDPSSKSLGTDIICHSSKYFPGSTGKEVLGFFQALRDNTIDDYARTHPAATAFLQEKRPVPRSFAHETFYSINAFKLFGRNGNSVFVRYRWLPLAGEHKLTDEELGNKSPNFIFEELPGILAERPVQFKLVVQVANDGDIIDDCTQIWPEERRIIDMGILELEEVLDNAEPLAFNPIPQVEGVEESKDPILAARSAVYSISSNSRLGSSP